MDQKPFGDFGDSAAFVDNPEPRVASVLVLDVSGSMNGAPIAELNEGLRTYQQELLEDSLATKRVEVAIVTFGATVETKLPFTEAGHFHPPHLEASGPTPMGEALNLAIDLVEDRKRLYRENGVMYYRPWIFLITDGDPTDDWRTVVPRVQSGEEQKSFMLFAVGTGDANFDTLKQIVTRKPLQLKGTRFRDLFKWLSNSQRSVSRSTPGEDVPLENPASPDGWATVS
jgi:uncharacterized protein YegL